MQPLRGTPRAWPGESNDHVVHVASITGYACINVTAHEHHRVRLNRCPQCGYDLTALPASHTCPECGLKYDQSMFILEGWNLPSLRHSPIKLVLFCGVLAILLLMCRGWLGWSYGLLGTLFFIAAVVYIGVHIYLKWRDDSGSRALARYLIASQGVGRLGGKVYPWRDYSHLMLIPDGVSGYRLHLYPSWWKLFGPPFVNAHIKGTEHEAEAIRDEIQLRINFARSKEAQAAAKARGENPRGW